MRYVADIIRSARQRAGLSQVRAAALAGVAERTVQLAEGTGATSTRTLCRLAEVYGCRVELVPSHFSEDSTSSQPSGNANGATTAAARRSPRPVNSHTGG